MRIVEIGNKSYVSLYDLNLKSRPDEKLIHGISVLSESGYTPLEIIKVADALELTTNTKLKEFLQGMIQL
jgi:hypothetical protein